MLATEVRARTRLVVIPVSGGRVTLEVPEDLSDQTLYKEIATQDISRGRLLEFIDQILRISGSNRELLLCSEQKLQATTRDFLRVCSGLRQFVADLETFHSAIPELEEARGDVRTFFYGYIKSSIDEVADFQKIVFARFSGEVSSHRYELNSFRKILAKIMGMVRTELQKIFAHLFARDPRNLYRTTGPRPQQEILFRQFLRDVEITEMLYSAVRRLDTYMRGAIIPSDLIKMIAERIETEGSVACLFEEDYASFLNDLIEEVQAILVPELYEVLHLDGIWFDEFENIESKAKMLSNVCLSFQALFKERHGMRQAVQQKIGAAGAQELGEQPVEEGDELVLEAFETHRHREIAQTIRSIDQILVDLEGTLLQWEKGISKRAFAKEEWREAEPLRRRAGI